MDNRGMEQKRYKIDAEFYIKKQKSRNKIDLSNIFN